MMKHGHGPDRHLDTRSALDYLDHKLDPSARRAAEAHLGRPCGSCRERLRELGEVLEQIRTDDASEVPGWLHERAKSVFQRAQSRFPAARAVEVLARLVFDSFAAPLAAATRRSVGEARRLRFQFGELALEIEIERESSQTVQLRGWLEAADATLYDLTVSVAGETRRLRPDGDGRLAAEGVPEGAIRFTVHGPAGHWQLPSIGE